MFLKARRDGAAGAFFTAKIPHFGSVRVRKPAATDTGGEVDHIPWISEDNFCTHMETRGRCGVDLAMFDTGIDDDWQWFIRNATTVGALEGPEINTLYRRDLLKNLPS
jgi:hypothetical protein